MSSLGRDAGTTARHGSAAVPHRAVPGRASAVPCLGSPFGHVYLHGMYTLPNIHLFGFIRLHKSKDDAIKGTSLFASPKPIMERAEAGSDSGT